MSPSIVATAIEYIGKEANRWEEQFYLGAEPEAQTEYGTAPENHERILGVITRAVEKFGQRTLATAAGVSLREVSAMLRSEQKPAPAILENMYRAVPRMETAAHEQAEHAQEVLEAAREHCQLTSVRHLADQAGVDQANLGHVLSGRRKLNQNMLTKLRLVLARG